MNSSKRPLNVLILEDELLWRRIIRHTVNKHNVRFVEATTLTDALVVLGNESFDLVFSDYELPDGCGLDILDIIDHSLLGMFVLISGFVGPEELRDSRSSKVDRFLTKPFLSSDLVACVEAVTPAYCPR